MSARVVRTFTWRVVFWREYGGNSGNGGKVGQKRVIFFLVLAVVMLLHQFLCMWRHFPVLTGTPRLSTAPDSRRSAGGWGAGCRFRRLRVALSRVRAGRLPVFGLVRMASHRIPCCPCCAMCSLQSCHGPPWPADSLCQRESWLGENSTFSVMPIEISAPSYYITAFDAIALVSGGSSRVK